MMNLTLYHFITYKKAESLNDCQDAFEVNKEHSRYAVADGATRSFFPKCWAELLVKHFCETPDLSLEGKNWKEWLVPIQAAWYKRVKKRVKARNQFYLTNSFNAREPAVATFIGLEIDKVEWKWQAIIIGDSCLFHKSNSGFKSYLIEKSEDFTSHPAAFASFPERNHYNPTFIGGDIQSGDLLILATDALAKWIVQHEEAGQLEAALNQLKQIKTNKQFDSFVDLARGHENIRLVNDDVTLMLILIEETEPSETREDAEELSVEVQTSEDVESRVNALEFVFWVILAGIFGFVIGAIILVVILLNKS
jgi:hypothetical protein